MNNIKIRKATIQDLDYIINLLKQVHDIHEHLRPDLFIKRKQKYTKEELANIIKNADTPIFVATNENDKILGHTFLVHLPIPKNENQKPLRTLYVDDLCVDEKARGMHVGLALWEYIKNYAKENAFYDITLNVWEGNPARIFYDKMGLKVKETMMEYIL